MKSKLIKCIIFISASALATAPTAQAQTWTNSTTGVALPIGQSITVAGTTEHSAFGYLWNMTCNVSIDGTVTASDTITFYRVTPDFVSNCTNPQNNGSVQFPLTAKAQFSGASPTGERAIVNMTYNNPVGICTGTAIPFDWYDALVSEARLPDNFSAGPCTLHAGSNMHVVAPGSLVGNVDIR